MFKRVALVSLAVAAGAANAAVPTGAEGAFTSLATDAATILGYTVTAVLAIRGGWLVIGMIKKGMSKSV